MYELVERVELSTPTPVLWLFMVLGYVPALLLGGQDARAGGEVCPLATVRVLKNTFWIGLSLTILAIGLLVYAYV